MIEPIVHEFDVRATPDHAFATWTDGCAHWWPTSHSVSGAPGFSVVFEPYEGGRIYEVGADGREHDWGSVLIWEPPHRLRYRWHIFLDPNRATLVEVTFIAQGNRTRVRLVNSGFEVFGEGAAERAGRVSNAWIGITGEYRRVW